MPLPARPCVPARRRPRRHVRYPRCADRSTRSADHRRCLGAESGADAASRRDRVQPRLGARPGLRQRRTIRRRTRPSRRLRFAAAPRACRRSRARALTTARASQQLTGEARTPPSRHHDHPEGHRHLDRRRSGARAHLPSRRASRGTDDRHGGAAHHCTVGWGKPRRGLRRRDRPAAALHVHAVGRSRRGCR